MRQAELLSETRRARAELEALVGSLSEKDMTTPGPGDLLSVRDLVAHVAAWARLAASWITDDVAGREVVRYAPGYEIEPDMLEIDRDRVMDRLNFDIFDKNRGEPSDLVLADFRQAMDELEGAMGTLSDAELVDAGRFAWAGYEPWLMIAGNGHEHIDEHVAAIRAWLGR